MKPRDIVREISQFPIGLGTIVLSERIRLCDDEYSDSVESLGPRELVYHEGASAVQLRGPDEILGIAESKGLDLRDVIARSPEAVATCVWNLGHEGQVLQQDLGSDLRTRGVPGDFGVDVRDCVPVLDERGFDFSVLDIRPEEGVAALLRVHCDIPTLECGVIRTATL
jgi:hypothetical protein